MAELFDFFRKQAISLGLSNPTENRDYIRQEQSIQTANLLKEREVTKRLEMEEKDRQEKIQMEKESNERKLTLRNSRSVCNTGTRAGSVRPEVDVC